MNSKYTKEQVAEIISLYKKGMSQKDIAKQFGTYNTSIRRILLKNGITIRSNSNIQRLCKHNPFKRSDELSDYFLGLLLTDGCISKNKTKNSKEIRLALTESDGYIVEKFRNWASPKSKLQKIHQKLNDSYMTAVSFTNEETEEWLQRQGNFNNKSYECKIYKPLNFNILRGIFDGDGGFHANSGHLDFFICSKSLEFAKQIHRFLLKNNFTSHLRINARTSGDFYYVEIYKIQDVLLLGEKLYNNASIFLKRKYDKWLAFYESRRANGVNSGNEMAIQP